MNTKRLIPLAAAACCAALVPGCTTSGGKSATATETALPAATATPSPAAATATPGLSATPTSSGNPSWHATTGPVTMDLWTVHFVSPSQGWISGGNVGGTAGVILSSSGGAWTVQKNTAYPAFAVSLASATDGWASGGGFGAALFERWNGSSWSGYTPPSAWDTYTACHAVSATEAWLGSFGGTCHRWSGSTWNAVTSPITTAWTSFDFVDATHVWATGGTYGAGAGNGSILYFDGSSWTVQQNVVAVTTMGSVSMLSNTDGFAVGYGGTIYRWNGSIWTLMTSGTTTDLTWVSAVSANEAFASGAGGLILRWNGTSWLPQTSGTTSTLACIQMLSPSLGWAVGAGGTIAAFY